MAKNSSAPYGKLEKAIVSSLIKEEYVTVADLQAKLSILGNNYTLQAIYHVLRKLRKDGVVVKVKNKFSISFSWVLEVIDLSKSLNDRFVSGKYLSEILPKEGEDTTLKFTSLLTLDQFWLNLMVALLEKSRDKAIYNYCPFPWFYFLHQSSLENFYRKLARRGSKIYLVCGSNGYLSQYFSEQLDKRLYLVKFSDGRSVGGNKANHVMVIGDFLIEVCLGRKLSKSLESCFSEITSTEHHDIHPLVYLLNQSTKVAFKIYRNSARAEQLKGVFREIMVTIQPNFLRE